MSVKLISKAWETPLKGSDLLVLISLCDWANDEGECFPKQETILKRVKIGKTSLNHILNDFEDIGLIKRELRNKKNGDFASTIYTLNLEISFEKHSDIKKRRRAKNSKCEHAKNDNVNTPKNEKCEHADVENVNTPTITQPSISFNHHSTGGDVEVKNDFDLFWDAYPKKTGKDDARKSFEKAIKKVSLQDLIRSVEAHKFTAQWNRENKRFIPNPATYLNQGRWQDEIELSDQDKAHAIQQATGMSALELLQARGYAS